ncbi:hypothetical protein [Halomonas sp. PR-M31]|uniref:hypothetical protein n=1 Tax=Halomonas sp. PR-M31 TaxID=1471202 RepID=UPI00065056FD|nr:hypothetical protein [Halomonas sp. PR-M31]
MLDTLYMQRILKFIAEGSYEGALTPDLWLTFVESSNTETASFHRFVYHMNELVNAGLIKERDVEKSGWGFNPDASLDEISLVLTPIGQQFLVLLSQPPKGLPTERLEIALRHHGDAGKDALRFAVGTLLKH